MSEAQPRARRICYAVADSITNEGERRATARRRCLSVSYFGLAFVKQINQTDRCPVERRNSRATAFFCIYRDAKKRSGGRPLGGGACLSRISDLLLLNKSIRQTGALSSGENPERRHFLHMPRCKKTKRRATARRRCLSVSYFGLAFVKQINQTDRCPAERRNTRHSR